MITASDAVLAAVGFLGLGTPTVLTDRPLFPAAAEPASGTEGPASPDLLSAGEPYFEEVAAELRRTGYLDA